MGNREVKDMKRTLTILLCAAALMTLLLCGCSDKEPTITSITRGTGAGGQTVTTTTVATDPSAEGSVPTSAPSAGKTTKATQPTARPTVVTDGDSSEVGTAIAQRAVDLIGSPYTAGGTGPAAFDNPGFVAYCYKESGYTVSRTLSSVLSFGAEAPTDALQPGDILLFCENGTGKPTFAGIYIGNSRFVACKNKESGTTEQALNNSYWLPRLIAARRAG